MISYYDQTTNHQIRKTFKEIEVNQLSFEQAYKRLFANGLYIEILMIVENGKNVKFHVYAENQNQFDDQLTTALAIMLFEACGLL